MNKYNMATDTDLSVVNFLAQFKTQKNHEKKWLGKCCVEYTMFKVFLCTCPVL